MKKAILLISIFLYTVPHCSAQDLIFKKTGEVVEGKVIEVNPSEIQYKKKGNPDGPTYTSTINSLNKVQYENGTVDSFGTANTLQVNNSTSTAMSSFGDPFKVGREDARLHYRDYVGAGSGTFVVSLLSPIVGLIPAIATSATPPLKKNLNYPSDELMNNTAYANGYKTEAYKIKKRKVWSNWGVAFGVNIILAMYLVSAQASR